jgi:MoaA/NifB/PqqE/SkfB family radical SAM enzyme
MSKIVELPSMICFRVTRFCNARCGFCLAPPDGGVHPAVEVLRERIDWLFANDVRTIHFCGGEPTIHHQLHELVEYVHAQHHKSKLTTNGIALPDRLVRALYTTKTPVKVSLHGPKDHHNEVVGCDAFDKTVATIRRLLAAGISTSVQTTIVAGHLSVVEWILQFCLDNGVKLVSFLPFIPRGNGLGQRSKYELSVMERRKLHELVKQKRHKLMSSIDVRLLDFNARPIHVVEPDGRVVLEKATEAMDELLYQIPQLTVLS